MKSTQAPEDPKDYYHFRITDPGAESFRQHVLSSRT